MKINLQIMNFNALPYKCILINLIASLRTSDFQIIVIRTSYAYHSIHLNVLYCYSTELIKLISGIFIRFTINNLLSLIAFCYTERSKKYKSQLFLNILTVHKLKYVISYYYYYLLPTNVFIMTYYSKFLCATN